jgi:hypothetical protein
MPFGAITTVYLPISASAGASLWGSDVRKLLASADATADTTSTTVHGTGGATRRTVDPYTASSTDGVDLDYGWAITPADMGSTSTKKRRQAAGNHTCTVRLSHSATLGSSGAILHFSVARVGAGGSRTRTLLGSIDQPVSLGALGAEATFTAAVSLPEIIYQDDETLQYSFEITATGQALSGASSTFRTGTSGGVAVKVDFPRLDTIAEIVGSSSGAGDSSAVVARIMAANGDAAGTSVASGSVGGVAAATGSAAGTSTGLAQVGAVSACTGSAAGIAAAQAPTAVVKGTVGTSEVGTGGGGTTVTYIRPTYIFGD